MSARMKLVMVAGMAAGVGLAAVAAPARAQDGSTQVQGPGAAEQAEGAAPAPMFASADELLDALETADEGLRTLQSGIGYIRVKSLSMTVESRYGRLYFVSEPAPDGGRDERQFALDFQKTVIGDVRNDDRSVVLFDGRRLYDKDYGGKLMIVRHVVDPMDPEAEARDPLRLGEGPLPIPIGQKKEDILARYEAELVANLTEGLETPEDPLETEEIMYPSFRTQVTGEDGAKAHRTVQLRLKARDAEGAEFKDIRLWYRREPGAEGQPGRLLPFMARAITSEGDVAIFQLSNVRVNAELAGEAREVMSPVAPRGWQTQVRDFEG